MTSNINGNGEAQDAEVSTELADGQDADAEARDFAEDEVARMERKVAKARDAVLEAETALEEATARRDALGEA